MENLMTIFYFNANQNERSSFKEFSDFFKFISNNLELIEDFESRKPET